MLACLDEGVGNVTAALRRRGLLDETLIWFQVRARLRLRPRALALALALAVAVALALAVAVALTLTGGGGDGLARLLARQG